MTKKLEVILAEIEQQAIWQPVPSGDTNYAEWKCDMHLADSARTAIPKLLAVIERLWLQRNYWMNEFYDASSLVKNVILESDAELVAILESKGDEK